MTFLRPFSAFRNAWKFFSHCADIRSTTSGEHATGSAFSSSAECPAVFTAFGSMTPAGDSGPTWGFGNDTAAGDTTDERLEFDEGDTVSLDSVAIPYGVPLPVRAPTPCPAAQLITNEAECRAAAAVLALSFSGVAGSEWASGCLFHNNGTPPFETEFRRLDCVELGVRGHT